MARVSKQKAGSAAGGYTWDRDGAVIDVPDALATELCAIPGGGFKTVPEDAVLTPPPGEAEPLTNVPQPATFPAGQTVDGDVDEANQLLPGLPAHAAPVPAGWAQPGGEHPTPDYPHGRSADIADGVPSVAQPQVLTEAEVVSASQRAAERDQSTDPGTEIRQVEDDPDPRDETEEKREPESRSESEDKAEEKAGDEHHRPPHKAARARARKRVAE